MLNLRRDGGRQIRELPHLREELTCVRHGDEAVVLLCLSILLRLHRFDHADEAGWHDRADRYRFIHEHEDVERVAVIAGGRWNESEIEWKAHPLWQHFLHDERRSIAIVCELRPRAAWRL